MDFTCHYDSPLGGITLACDGNALTGLWFDGQRHFAAGMAAPREGRELPVFADARRWLDLYFSGKDPGFIPRLNLRATPFREKVWEILLEIPYGRTVTYGEIAAQAAKRRGLPRMSARAAGGAVGHNPVSLIVPCHRVVGANGRLTGYAGGTERKAILLEMEKGRDLALLIRDSGFQPAGR